MRCKMKFSEKVKYARMKLLLTQEALAKNSAFPTPLFAVGKKTTANRKSSPKASFTHFAKVKALSLKSNEMEDVATS